jgi:CHAD domain-containing protein
LGAVRDLDVALANLRAFGRVATPSKGNAMTLLRGELKNRRAQAHAELLSLLDSKKHRNLISDLVAFCVAPSPSKEPVDPFEVVPTQVRHTLPGIILAAFEKVRAYETLFTGIDQPPLESLHALRIQAKSLRYLLEFSRHLLGDDGNNLIAHLRELQEYLGELNDAHVEHDRLDLWAKKLQTGDPLRELIESRLAHLATRLHELAAAAPSHLAAFVNQANRQTLAKAISRL